MIAHVLTGGPIPSAVQWLVASLLFAGAVAAFILRRRALRRAALAVAALGLAGTATTWVVDAGQPGPGPYGLRIAGPHGESQPDAVFTVCAVFGDGTLSAATDASHFLALFVDGRQAPIVDAWQIPIRLPLGQHVVRFDLVTPSSQEYSPPVTVEKPVTVTASAPPPGPLPC